MSFVIVDDDGGELSSQETDSNGRNSKSDTESNDFEEIFIDSQETIEKEDADSNSSKEYVNVDADEKSSSKNSSSLPKAVTTKSSSNSGGAQGDDKNAKKNIVCGEKVNEEELNFFSDTSLLLVNCKKREKMIDDTLRLYNNFALSNMSDACFRDASVSKKLLEPYRSCLDNFDEGLAAGYVAAISGNLDRVLENSLSDYVPFSNNISETFEHFDDLIKTISSIPMSKFDSGLLHYSIAKFYQCVGDIFSARFASGDFNQEDSRQKLCLYANACYVISLQYLKDAKLSSRKTCATVFLSICEMKIAITYSLNYYNIENELFELLKDIKLGKKLAQALWTSEKYEKTFLALNKVDYFNCTVIPQFDFQKDFANNISCIWELHSVEGFLDHLLFIIGYGRVTDYSFLKKVLPNAKLIKGHENDLSSQIDIFLVLATFAIDYCKVSNYKFGYDYLFRSYLGLPHPDINFISPKIVDHSIVVPVARHGRPQLYAQLFWKAILFLGRDSSTQSRKALIEKHFRSEAAFNEILSNAVNEVNVQNRIHNFYIVSERFHLMLIWFICNGFGDCETNHVYQRLVNHVKYLEHAVSNESNNIIFDENEIDDAEMKGGILSQLFPKRSLYWLVYPNSKACEYLSIKSVQEVIAHYYAYTYGRESAEGKKYWDSLSTDYKTALMPPEEPEADLPEMSDIPETAEIVHASYDEHSHHSDDEVEEECDDAVEDHPSYHPQPKQQCAASNSKENESIISKEKEERILLSREMELEREKYQKTTEGSIQWSKLIEQCGTNLGVISPSSNLYDKEFQELRRMIAEQKGELMKKAFAKLLVTENNIDGMYEKAVVEMEHKLAEYEARKVASRQMLANLSNVSRKVASFSSNQNPSIPGSVQQPNGQMPSSAPPYSAADLFRCRLEEARRLMNNFVGIITAHQAIIVSQIAFATCFWTFEQKQHSDIANLQHYYATFGVPCPPLPDLSSIYHLLQPIFPIPPANPFKMNAPPRGFLTNAMSQNFNQTAPQTLPAAVGSQFSQNSEPICSQSSSTSVISMSSTNAKFMPSLSSSTTTTESEHAGGMVTPQKSTNEAFRLAFEHWRGLDEDTPKEIRMKAVAPSLTPKEIAQYVPTINFKTDDNVDNDDLLFPPRAGESRTTEEIPYYNENESDCSDAEEENEYSDAEDEHDYSDAEEENLVDNVYEDESEEDNFVIPTPSYPLSTSANNSTELNQDVANSEQPNFSFGGGQTTQEEEIRIQAVAPSIISKEIAQYVPTNNIKNDNNDDLLCSSRARKSGTTEEIPCYDESNKNESNYPDAQEENSMNNVYEEDDIVIPAPSYPLSSSTNRSSELNEAVIFSEQEDEGAQEGSTSD